METKNTKNKQTPFMSDENSKVESATKNKQTPFMSDENSKVESATKNKTTTNTDKKVTASQYAEMKGVRRLESFLKRVYGKEVKTFAEWEKIFKAERYI